LRQSRDDFVEKLGGSLEEKKNNQA